ncbi:hypothetical protein EXN66_Car007015 [Channa argus]|uniref:Amino acid transporter transmembrane domain-containing protein n=1 Tax=Channa argus TaxID=215402 RepID=A0A6G1PM08_CHAAH|nr:hypothetical protein EXN66_Car007015 [Channa argus]
MMATDAEAIRTQTTPCPIPDTSLSTLPITLTRKNQDRQWKLRFIYLQCYFLTVATILGTGILGLPVTIAHAGLVPFLISFLTGFFVQTGVAECIVMDQVGVEDPSATDDEDEDEVDNADADTGLLQPDAVCLHEQAEGLQPNLHLLGRLFLSRPMSHAFNCILLLQFISIGISYVLAGSEAYAALFNVSHIYVIPAFTWILALAILLAHTVIQPITSLLTLLKGILLIVTVAVTFAVGTEVGLQSSSDFRQMGKPFLMGTVALGGIVNVMPLLFSQISHNKTQVLWFRRAVLAGLTTCTILNILWSEKAGEIATIPLTKGFVVMLDKFVSFSLNTEVGLFVFIMLRESREDRFQQLAVPLPVGDCVFSLSWLLPTYFLFAVTYDILQTLADVAHFLPFYSHSQEPPNHNLSGSLTAANLSVLL